MMRSCWTWKHEYIAADCAKIVLVEFARGRRSPDAAALTQQPHAGITGQDSFEGHQALPEVLKCSDAPDGCVIMVETDLQYGLWTPGWRGVRAFSSSDIM